MHWSRDNAIIIDISSLAIGFNASLLVHCEFFFAPAAAPPRSIQHNNNGSLARSTRIEMQKSSLNSLTLHGAANTMAAAVAKLTASAEHNVTGTGARPSMLSLLTLMHLANYISSLRSARLTYSPDPRCLTLAPPPPPPPH